jgi:hypothetical protein
MIASAVARKSGLAVPQKTTDAGVSYIKKCFLPATGGFAYMLHGGGKATFSRTAAAVATLQAMGIRKGEEFGKGSGQATTERVRRTVQTVKRFGQGVGMALVAAGGVLAGIFYAARKQITSVAAAVYCGGRRLLGRAITTLASMMPSFAFGGTKWGEAASRGDFGRSISRSTAAAATVRRESNPEAKSTARCLHLLPVDARQRHQRTTVLRPNGLVA